MDNDVQFWCVNATGGSVLILKVSAEIVSTVKRSVIVVCTCD